jgi:hypothetical protein
MIDIIDDDDMLNPKTRIIMGLSGYKDQFVKENAHSAFRQVPVESSVNDDGTEELESTTNDVLKALRDVGFFDLRSKNDGEIE